MSERRIDDLREANTSASEGLSSGGDTRPRDDVNTGRCLYAGPRLRKHGRLVDLTMGGSPGPGDSGSNINFHQVI